MKKRMLSLMLALTLLTGLLPAGAEGLIDLDSLMAAIEAEEAANGAASKRFTETLALLPDGTALYTDEALTDLFGTLKGEGQAYVLQREGVDEAPENDLLLVGLAVNGAVELLWLRAGETVPLTADEQAEPGCGLQVPGTGVWLREAAVTRAEERPEGETDPVDEELLDQLLEETVAIDPEAKVSATITTQPGDQVASVGDEVTVSVVTSNAKTYQWQYTYNGGKSWANCSTGGANTSAYTFTALEKHYGRLLRCAVTGPDGLVVYSRSAGLYEPMRITSQPGYRTGSVGAQITLKVGAENVKAYQWQYSYNDGKTWVNCLTGGCDTASYTFTIQEKHYDRVMRCLLTDMAGVTRASNISRLYRPMVISAQPQSRAAAVGAKISLTVAAENVRSYLWQYSYDGGKTWVNCASGGYNTDTYTYTVAEKHYDRLMRCKLTAMSYSTKYTGAVSLYRPVVIGAQPAETIAAAGDSVTLTVEAENVGAYLWQYSYNNGGSWKNCATGGYDTASYTFTVTEQHYSRLLRCRLTQLDGSCVYTGSAGVHPALVITSQPGYRTGSVGAQITLKVGAENVGSYQWQYSYDNGKTWVNCASGGYNTANYTFTIQEKHYDRVMRCVLTDLAGGTHKTSVSRLYRPMVILTQPGDRAAKTGEKITLTVEAENVRSYQWQYSTDSGKTWANCASGGYNTASYTMTVAEKHYSTLVRCKLTAMSYSVKYTALTHIYRPVSITAQPAAACAAVGDTVSVSVTAENAGAYLWQYSYNGGKSWKDCATGGHDTDTYTYTVTAQHYSRLLRCRLTQLDGTWVYSGSAALHAPVDITSQPQVQWATVGSTVTYTVAAENVSAYRWQYSYDGGGSWSNCSTGGYNTASYSFTAEEKHFTRLMRCRLTQADGTWVYTIAVSLNKIDTGAYTVTRLADGSGVVITGFSGDEVDLVIPADFSGLPVRGIGESAFSGHTLVAVSLPEGLRTIGESAFAGTGLTFVSLPSTLTDIDSTAFSGCDGLMAEALGTAAQSFCSANSVTVATVSGLDVERHTQAEIQAFADSHPFNLNETPVYLQARTDDPYDPGTLSAVTIQSGLNAVNRMRYIAGLSANVTANSGMHAALMAAAMANALNNTLTHYPERPSQWADSQYDALYQLAAAGARSSNLAMGTPTLPGSVLLYMDDSNSASNRSAVGHRRWILNPSMGTTTFGYCGYYSGMYAFDSSGSSTGSRVAWPAQLMPIQYFDGDQMWSLSLGVYLAVDRTSVRLTRKSDGQTWVFNSVSADGLFYAENSGYGSTGCIIFRPDSISISQGDCYSVEARDGRNGRVYRYEVTFCGLSGASAGSLAQTASLTAENRDEGICLTWQTVSGANGYYVCRRESGAGYYGIVADVNGTSWTDTGTALNTLYSYRLIPHSSCVTGTAAEVECARVDGTYDALWGSCPCVISGSTMTVKTGVGSADPAAAPWKTAEGLTGLVFEDGVVFPADCGGLFEGCETLTGITFGAVDTSQMTSAKKMFSGCAALQTLDLTMWSTAGVTSAEEMFSGCASLTAVSMNGWNTAALRSMNGMFSGCAALTDIGLSGWNTALVTDVAYLCDGCSSLTSLDALSGLRFNTLRYAQYAFRGCAALTDADGVSGWDMSSAWYTNYMFSGCAALTSVDFSGWNPSAAMSMFAMFENCTSLVSANLSGWAMPELSSAGHLFRGCAQLQTVNLSGWTVTELSNVSWMFYGCSALTTVTGLDSLNMSSVTSLYCMFYSCASLKTLDLSGWDTAAVTNFSYLFANCSSLATLSLSGWNTGSATNMSYMFTGSAITTVTLGAGFTFKGSGEDILTTLPSGTWKSQATGLTCSAEEIAQNRNNIADTYTRQ